MSKTTDQAARQKCIVFLCLFSAVFLIVMTCVVIKINDISENYRYRSLHNRLRSMEYDEEDTHKDISYNLYYDNDYEPLFSRFWEYSVVETAYVDGLMYKRAIQNGDPSKQADLDGCTQQIQDYIASTDSSYLKNTAQAYLDALLN